ncbi:MAG: ABC transporter ATP-binding protein [Planctomycetes bacterium]|nr:ABC transporter ATP-binding protein [Planctomycetota bacterium]
MLEVRGLEVRYGAVQALRGVSLDVRQGEIVSLIGTNGAGKSSTLMAISGIARASAGAIAFEGRDILGRPAHEIVARGLAQVPEGRRVFPRLTVRENLEMGAFLQRGSIDGDLARVHTLFPVLQERAQQLAGTLSGGEQQMLAIGRALMGRPRLLMMDEPSMGIAPILVARIFEAIRELNTQGLTVLLVEQNARAALRLSSRAFVVENGRTTITGSGRELLHDERIASAYLGGA